jgi:hypothetical protein
MTTADQQVSVREVESPAAVHRSIPKQKNAPYVSGLEPEAAQLAPLNHFSGSEQPELDPDEEEFLLMQSLDPKGVYYRTSTKAISFLMILLAIALLGVWNYTYNQEPRFIPTNQTASGSSFQGAGLKNNNNNNKKKPKHQPNPPPQTAPPAVGYWSNFEFGLDKIRSVETLKGFAVLDKSDILGEWISNPVVVDALFQCLAAFALSVVSISIAKAIPVFPIFLCVGCCFLSWVATLGDLFVTGSVLHCFTSNLDEIKNNNNNNKSSSNSAGLIISANGCSFPMILHAFCVNIKWLLPSIATIMLIVSVRFRGGLMKGIFKNVLNLTILSGLPICAHALRFYFWYFGLSVVAEAVGPEHGWMLIHQEDLIRMSFNVFVITQSFVWLCLGFALYKQRYLIVREELLPSDDEEKKKEENIKEDVGEEEDKTQQIKSDKKND